MFFIPYFKILKVLPFFTDSTLLIIWSCLMNFWTITFLNDVCPCSIYSFFFLPIYFITNITHTFKWSSPIPGIPTIRFILNIIYYFKNLLFWYCTFSIINLFNGCILLICDWINVFIEVVIYIIIFMPTHGIIFHIIIYNECLYHKRTCTDTLLLVSPCFFRLNINIFP